MPLHLTWRQALASGTRSRIRSQTARARPGRSARLAGGHRLYDAADAARLYRIIRLRQLGFPLSQVGAVLAQQDDPSPGQLFSTVEEMINMDGIIQGTTGLLLYDDVDAAHDYIVGVTSDPEGQIWWFQSPLG
jgi:MerR family transcriptional regulator, thiopeptide resistance regulator